MSGGYIPEGVVWTAVERDLDHHDAEEWPRAEATVAALVKALYQIKCGVCDYQLETDYEDRPKCGGCENARQLLAAVTL